MAQPLKDTQHPTTTRVLTSFFSNAWFNELETPILLYAAKLLRPALLLLLFGLLTPTCVFAQGMDMSGMGMMDMNMVMMGGVIPTVPMTQEGSGTSWHPEASPMYVHMYETGSWMTMLHGHIAPRYIDETGKRGTTAFDAPNYLMAMTQHALGTNGQIMFRGMFSADWLTEQAGGGQGYPLLLQTGETWKGQRIVDYQHPHDLFSELSTTLSYKFSSKAASYLYLGYPGEPSIGPPVFMHRPSAMTNPDAPLSHHWQDATHITFGVATWGFAYDNIKVEGSIFNGSEPDENRTDFDKLKLNSYSGRLSYNPTKDLAFQISQAYEVNPEGDKGNEHLTSASLMHAIQFTNTDWWASTASWSMKKDHHTPLFQESVLLESELHWKRNILYSRFEYVEKPQIELGLEFDPAALEPIKKLTVGVARTLFDLEGIEVDAGVQGSLHFIPSNIRFVYQSDNDSAPKSVEVFLSIHPTEYPTKDAMTMEDMHM